MATYQSIYTGAQIDEAVGKAQTLTEQVNELSEEIAKKATVIEKPLVYIDGEIPTTKDNVLATMTVKSSWLNFFAYIKIKCQGNTSMKYPKKNFTVTLFEDDARTIPMMITIPGWKIASNKFVFKANWIDHLHARNVITARIWSEIVASRPDYDTLPAELRNSPNNGAVDGFPIIGYLNGQYSGLYTWNIGKDAWMWGMDEDNTNHNLLCAETNTDGIYMETPCNFRALWSGVDGTNWSIEVGENSDALKNSLNALISCVKDTTDEEFLAQIETYLDVQSAIDYYLMACSACGIDNLGKNMLIGTYDLRKWMLGAYDLDSTWGLMYDGSRFVPDTMKCPDSYQEAFSLLFARITSLFKTRLVERGRELRQTVLSIANINAHFERFAAEIGSETYADDLVPYPDIPSSADNNIWQIREFVPARLAYMDSWLSAIDASVPCTSVSVASEQFMFETTDAQSLGVTLFPADTTDEVHVYVSDSDVVTYSAGLLIPNGNGNAYVDVICGSKTARCSVVVNANFDDEDDDVVNLFSVSDKTAVIFNLSQGPTVQYPVEFRDEEYYGYNSRNGYIIEEDRNMIEHEINDGIITIRSKTPTWGSILTGYGLFIPIQFEIGAAYRATYDITNNGRLSIVYYDADRIFAKFVDLNSEGNTGTNSFEKSFTAENYPYAFVHVGNYVAEDGGESIYSDIVISKV